ncbi:MAG: response regulator [Methylotenera sp.]|nr:response regulator [Oligoflexia bacterium]
MSNSASIYVIEDDQDIRDSLVEILELEGYAPEGFSNGQEAIESLQCPKSLPEVMLLDLMMPVMGGREFLQAREQLDPSVRSIPVYLLSAVVPYRGPLEGQVAGQMRKPVNIDDLLSVIERHAKGSRPQKSRAA